MKLINIGFGNIVSANRIVSVISPESAPVKRMITKAKSENTLIDATFGRKTKTVIITDCEQIILCAFSAERVFGQSDNNLIKFMETEDE